MKRLAALASILLSTAAIAAEAPATPPPFSPEKVTISADLQHIVSYFNTLPELSGKRLTDAAPPGTPPKREAYDIGDDARIVVIRDQAALRDAYTTIKQAEHDKIAAAFDSVTTGENEQPAGNVAPFFNECTKRKMPEGPAAECLKKLLEIDTAKVPIEVFKIPVRQLNLNKNHIDSDLVSLIDPLLDYAH